MMGSRVGMNPEWVLFGEPVPNGVVVYASDSLGEAELRAVVLDGRGRVASSGGDAAGLRGVFVMGNMRTQWGPTYGEAIRTLFANWSPGEQAALPPPEPAALESPEAGESSA